MKCETCGSLMHWEGSLRSGSMKCTYCAVPAPLPVIDVEIFNAQPADPAGCHDDLQLTFYATPVSHDEDETECKRCGHIWTSKRVDAFTICSNCHIAGWKEYV